MFGRKVPSIPEYFSGKDVFLTGGTGFVGKVLIEKLLRSCPDVRNIYVLVRPKRNKTLKERREDIVKAELFDIIRKANPSNLDKVKCISGDTTELKLGISDEDERLLTSKVHIIYHVAASVRFDDPLREAIITNIRSTREIIRLALKCSKLEAFMHVSTAYCNVDHNFIEEKLYTAPLNDTHVRNVKMRPRLKKCRGAVKRRDVATQTDVFDFWNPRVVLKRVGCPREKSPPREDEEVATDGKSEVSEIVTVQEKPMSLSKLPSSYRLFVKPITNNDRANSTLLLDAQEEMLVHNIAFVKPGPLCYKKRISEKMSRSLTAPRVRQEPEELEDRNGLEPLLENPLETASTPDMLELNLNVSSIGSMIEYNERSTQTQTAGTSQEIDQGGTGEGKSDEPPPVQDEDPPPGPSVIDAELNDEPIRESNAEPIEETRAANTSFRMKMNGVATTITTVPEDGTTPDSSSDESGSDQNNPRESRRTKFLKIRAHTVHIHNHFYGGRK